MRKSFSFIICTLLILIMFASCGLSNVSVPPMPTATPVPVVTAIPTATPVPEVDTTGYDNPIIITINNIELKDLDPAYNSYEILNFRCQVPTVHIEGKDEASSNINTVLEENCKRIYSNEEGVETTLDKRNELLMLAEDNFKEDSPIEFKYSRMVNILRADDNLIVIQFKETTKTFGEEEVSEETLYFDTKSGNEIDALSSQNEEFKEPTKLEKGSLSVSKNSPTDKHVLDLIVDSQDGEDYFVTCDGVVYDLFIGDKWYCNILKDTTIQLRTIIPEGMPTLPVSYTSGNEVYIYILGKNLDTGNVTLLDSSEVEAVG